MKAAEAGLFVPFRACCLGFSGLLPWHFTAKVRYFVLFPFLFAIFSTFHGVFKNNWESQHDFLAYLRVAFAQGFAPARLLPSPNFAQPRHWALQSRRLKIQSRRLFFQSRRLNFQSRRLETQNPRPEEGSRVWVCGKCRGGSPGFISPPSACPWACGGGRCRRAGRAGGMRRAWWWPGAGPWGCTLLRVRRRPFRGGRCPWRGCPRG